MKRLSNSVTDWIAYIVIAASAFSCQSPEQLLNKAVKRGAVIPYDTTEVIVEVPIVTDGDTVYVPKHIKVPCPDVEIPKTKVEIRQENRTKRVEARQKTKRENHAQDEETKRKKSDDNKTKRVSKQETKQTRIENRDCNRLWWFMFGGVVFTIGGIVFRWKVKPYLKMFLWK